VTATDQGAALVTEARSWIGTPYRHGARVKGAGCDCATLLAECLIAGGTDREAIGIYSGDWWMHASDERYMYGLLRNALKMTEAIAYRSTVAQPGDLVLTKVAGSKLYNHGGIVTQWPMIVHAVHPVVEEVDASKHSMWAYRELAIFSPKATA
jgi:NlpC/P60 family putative phage cell wall peptidase